VVVTKEPLDYKAMNEKINKGSGSYADKVNAAVADIQIENVQFKTTDKVAFQCDPQGKNAVAVIVEIDKK
jgi:hypothetical protein